MHAPSISVSDKLRKIKPKQVVHNANVSNPHCCFIWFLKKYHEHRPHRDSMTHDALYLTPIPSPNGKVRFKTTPTGINTMIYSE